SPFQLRARWDGLSRNFATPNLVVVVGNILIWSIGLSERVARARCASQFVSFRCFHLLATTSYERVVPWVVAVIVEIVQPVSSLPLWSINRRRSASECGDADAAKTHAYL